MSSADASNQEMGDSSINGSRILKVIEKSNATDSPRIMPLKSYVAVGTLNVRGRYSDEWQAIETTRLQILGQATPLAPLIKAGWARATIRNHAIEREKSCCRVFLLPCDRGRAVIQRTDGILSKRLLELMQSIDVSAEAWEGDMPATAEPVGFRSYSEDEDSLFYLFNTIPSPDPSDCRVANGDAQDSIDSLLQEDCLKQCKTKLYPYQRRSAATMIRREVEPRKSLDPRLTPVNGPMGDKIFYDTQTGQIFQDRKEYEEVRGGILAESMGYGKTLQTLATILATKGHWPSVPPQHSLGLHPVRPRIASLLQMVAYATGRANVAWRKKFEDLEETGEAYETCRRSLKENAATYLIPPPERRQSRRGQSAEPSKIQLCSATVIVVPQNLIAHWQREIAKHFHKGTFKVLVFGSKNVLVPPASDLMEIDILLFSRQRFEFELCPQASQRTDHQECSCPPPGPCKCPTDPNYHSPLLNLHFLRVVLDEGHEFASGRKNNTYFALARLIVDRKWILSGTPTSGLIGVEIGVAARNDMTNKEMLEARRKDNSFLLECKDLENIHAMMTKYLNVKPWSNKKSEDQASWQRYIMPHDDGRRKPASLRCLLNSLCVRHRIEDIEADVVLPPLHNKTVYLEPSWHDKLSQNAFICTLISNAVTSNRCDEDYMFHPKNRPALHTLINNLRQSGFYWTSFSDTELSTMIQTSRAYLEEDENRDLSWDRLLLSQAIKCGEIILSSRSWKAFSDLHELGLWVDQFPSECRKAWSLVPCDDRDIVLVGATQLNEAQAWVYAHLEQADDKMLEDLKSKGENTMDRIRKVLHQSQQLEAKHEGHTKDNENNKKRKTKPKSMHISEPKLSEIRTVSKVKAIIGTKQRLGKDKASDDIGNDQSNAPLKSALKSTLSSTTHLNASSKLHQSKLHGTVSSKLTYLLDRVSVLHQQEKILIFYEGDHIAYYIAQALDLIGVRYLIYTHTLDLALKSAYVSTFNAKSTFRVMLMDLKEAAAGLHVASASRIFMVNPIWQPDIEAQAIKRAHRIGQTRPVYSETLVLRNTIEDQMMQRRKQMSAQEHQTAEKSLLDDRTMRGTLENAALLPLTWEELHDVDAQIAKLASPIKLFGEPSQDGIDPTNPYADMIFPIETNKTKKLGIRKSTEEELESDTEAEALPHGKGPGHSNKRTFDDFKERENSPKSDSSKSKDSPKPAKKKKRVGFAPVVDQDAPKEASVRFGASDEAGPSSTAPRRVQFEYATSSPVKSSLFGGRT